MSFSFGKALVLNFEIEVAVAEDVVEGDGCLPRLLVLAFDQVFGDFSLEARRHADQPFGMLGEEFLADARLVIEAMQRRLGDDLHQVAISLIALGQHDQVVVTVALRRGAMIVLLADVEFAADDRLDPGLFGRVDKLDGSEDVAVVGHGHGGHAEFLDALDQVLGRACSVEHGVIGMQMQVNEFRHGVDTSILLGGGDACSR